MPHVILEYAQAAVAEGRAQALVDAVHAAVIGSGLFEPSHVKSRAVAVSHYRCGEDDRPFVHAQLRIKPGRANEQKQALSETVLNTLQGQVHAPAVITVEVVELAADSYAKAELTA